MESKLINLNSNNSLFFSYSDSLSSPDSDMEMISIESLSSYTSLKDVLRETYHPSPVDSPTKFKRIQSWKEIPIKDPLLQHAAWAYLQPISSEPDSDDRSCFWKLKDCFCGVFRRR
ncbi:hypothetical protein R6Q57_029697 [Mikania cordata]